MEVHTTIGFLAVKQWGTNALFLWLCKSYKTKDCVW